MNLLPKTLTSTPITNDIGDETLHLFDQPSITAINAALAVNRPLLVWGEPGIGKSQLAKAVARQLGRVFIPFVCDVHTESRDLLWHFDAVSRLAEAQVQPKEGDRDNLAIDKFMVPQALWWALNWKNAMTLARACEPAYQEPCHPDNGCVVLIDEIDKTASDVPNGLLEALGSSRFQPQGMDAVERDEKAVPPLVIITTNGETNLPDAFIRRCLSLHMAFPESEDEQRALLVERGRSNFPEFENSMVEIEPDKPQPLLEVAANMLIEDRNAAKAKHLYPLCGQAEYFDLLRGIKQLQQQDYGEAAALMLQLRPYIYQKLQG